MKYNFRIVDAWDTDCRLLVARRYLDDGTIEVLTTEGWETYPEYSVIDRDKFPKISGQIMMEELKVLTVLDEFETHLRKFMAIENSRH